MGQDAGALSGHTGSPSWETLTTVIRESPVQAHDVPSTRRITVTQTRTLPLREVESLRHLKLL